MSERLAERQIDEEFASMHADHVEEAGFHIRGVLELVIAQIHAVKKQRRIDHVQI